MDFELRCPSCKDYYQSPIYLPCFHSICYTCALTSLRSLTTDEQNNSFASDLDKLSLTSDNDSGISSSSRPSSLLLPAILPKIPLLSHQISYLQCPTCLKRISIDISGVKNLPKNHLLIDIINQYHREQQISKDRSITHIYEQDIFDKIDTEIFFCHEHLNQLANFYCLHCRLECCKECSKHNNHQILPLHQAVKFYKTQLSTQLQALSEKAKDSADFLMKLKIYPEYIQKNGEIFQNNLIKEIDDVILTLENKKQELIQYIHDEINRKISLIHKQYSSYNNHIQHTTGFLQFSIEALKHSKPHSYLQVCHGLNNKCSDLYESLSEKYLSKSHTSHELEFILNLDCLYQSIHHLQFQQIKPPLTPRFIPKQCICEINSGTLAWSIDDIGVIQGFILELDNGIINSKFQKIYDGNETICAIDGLVSSCVYTARVKAYNQAGESSYSECITLHSSSINWFTFNPRMSHPDIEFLSDEFDSISCLSLQERVALGSQAFRQGIHYWEITIQRYDNKPDPAFGIARFDVSKEHMLGKDSKSWCMYIDNQRSWFMHNGQHINRINGGISIGSVIGILLDLNNGTLRFYINDQPHGSIAFTNLIQDEVYYPAVSLNKNVHLTITSGLDPQSLISL